LGFSDRIDRRITLGLEPAIGEVPARRRFASTVPAVPDNTVLGNLPHGKLQDCKLQSIALVDFALQSAICDTQ